MIQGAEMIHRRSDNNYPIQLGLVPSLFFARGHETTFN